MNNISEKLLRQLFNRENMPNIRVNVSEGTAGTFFLIPEQGGVLVKSINKAEYTIL
jgi:hypothetical protein